LAPLSLAALLGVAVAAAAAAAAAQCRVLPLAAAAAPNMATPPRRDLFDRPSSRTPPSRRELFVDDDEPFYSSDVGGIVPSNRTSADSPFAAMVSHQDAYRADRPTWSPGRRVYSPGAHSPGLGRFYPPTMLRDDDVPPEYPQDYADEPLPIDEYSVPVPYLEGQTPPRPTDVRLPPAPPKPEPKPEPQPEPKERKEPRLRPAAPAAAPASLDPDYRYGLSLSTSMARKRHEEPPGLCIPMEGLEPRTVRQTLPRGCCLRVRAPCVGQRCASRAAARCSRAPFSSHSSASPSASSTCRSPRSPPPSPPPWAPAVTVRLRRPFRRRRRPRRSRHRRARRRRRCLRRRHRGG
jgi:hypothetical protein